MSVSEASGALLDLLAETGVRTDHPRYFGLFNPPALEAAIAGDLIANAVNPQLAVWSHAAGAVETELYLIDVLGRLIWDQQKIAGTFTSGGSEANHTALLCALARRYPEWPRRGLQAIDRTPAIFVSSESHLAWIKIARAAGLGSDAVRIVSARDGLSLDGATLAAAIESERNLDPVLIVATAGTTAHGAIDDVRGMATVAHELDTHFHVDAAWAGAALLSPEHRDILRGIECADSVTFDPHKWLAVPMGTGIYLARNWDAQSTAFAVTTGYMPSASLADRDPYIHSLQWSRRFNGAKLFLALATLGLDGYAQKIRHQFSLGKLMRERLTAAGFRIVNQTDLPLVCFVPERVETGTVDHIRRSVVESGEAWLSTVQLRGEPCLRACITSFETDESDVDALVAQLVAARDG